MPIKWLPERSCEVNRINHSSHNGKGGGQVGTLVIGTKVQIMVKMMVVNVEDLSWIFNMLEDKVYSKDVHILKDSPDPNPSTHRQVPACNA